MELKTRVQSNAKERGELSAIARLQLAMERHAALEGDASTIFKPRILTPKETSAATLSAAQQSNQDHQVSSKPAAVRAKTTNSVSALAEQLQSLRHEPNDASDPQRRRATVDTMSDSNDTAEGEDEIPAAASSVRQQYRQQHVASTVSSSSPSPPLANALLKIGSHEKDELLVHLLQQVAFFRGQLSEVATLGETIASQLVLQQHELRLKHREQITSLEQQLHDAVHFHPRVLGLERKVEALEASNREKDQQLRFAVQKLQRSRQREKELKTMQDPLWDI